MKQEKPKNPLHSYAKYSHIAIQMIIIILAGVFGGRELDKHMGEDSSLFTLIGSVLGVVLACFFAIYNLLKKK